jgi:sn-glycerol 3-phosphate transport system ATP-binding protein
MNLIPAGALSDQLALPPGTTLGLRPEDIGLADDGVPARLAGVEYLGADQLVAFDIGTDAAPARVLVRLPARQPLPADGHRLRWSPEACHLFDPQGQRLTDFTPD